MKTYLIVSLTAVFVGIIIAITNMAVAYNRQNITTSTFVTHIIAGLMYVGGAISSLVIGIIMLVDYIKS